jgi:hypothetical protein
LSRYRLRPNTNQEERSVTIERLVLAFAGIVILASLALAQAAHPNWLWLAAFVGANLLQAAFTGFCPLAVVLRRLGYKSGPAFSNNEGPATSSTAG